MSEPIHLSLPAEAVQAAIDAGVSAWLKDALPALRCLDKQQAADLLGVSPKTFLTLARKKGLKTISLGPRLARFTLAEVQSLIEP